ncbi:hypothetical protein [Hymenobacter sp. AT01-02]|uniref:hypothetical protein n=1 Tax=Hymenobacter sp. AT01-02 TaxID=1571877 RepID=UPI0005F23392|nr:hypothetical protein [Hymenobacter sp. AT01-02]
MRRYYSLLLGGVLLTSLTACPLISPIERIPIPVYKPLLMARPQLEQAVAVLPPRDMHNTGKIFLRDPYILINERYQGVTSSITKTQATPAQLPFCAFLAM